MSLISSIGVRAGSLAAVGLAMGLGFTMTTNASAGSAREVLGGLQNWKLNGYTGTLRVGNDDNGLDYRDSASKNDSHYFFDRGSWAVFRCYAGNPTSGGSSNPRSELRELTSNGQNDIFWDGTNSSEDSMKFRVRIDDLPPSGKICFAQIHAGSDSDFDDVIRVQVEGDEGQNRGSVKLRILGYVTEELEGGGRTIDFPMRMDTGYSFELTMRNRVVRLYETNSRGNRQRTLYTSGSVNSKRNYFKVGCYLQSTRSNHHDSRVYGQTRIKNLSVKH